MCVVCDVLYELCFVVGVRGCVCVRCMQMCLCTLSVVFCLFSTIVIVFLFVDVVWCYMCCVCVL